MTTHQDATKFIAERWRVVGAIPIMLEEETKLFRGMNHTAPLAAENVFDLQSLGIWCSGDIRYALNYCFRDRCAHRAVARLYTTCAVPALLFPDDFHPADAACPFHKNVDGKYVVEHGTIAYGISLNGEAADAFVSRHWSALSSAFGFAEAAGHVRYTAEDDSAPNGLIKELWLRDRHALRTDCVTTVSDRMYKNLPTFPDNDLLENVLSRSRSAQIAA